eukprot:Skav201759  [mRNA]  locus=scaffold1973:310298:317569:- [translate_table: standard]
MGGDRERICAFCGLKDAPARCSRCLRSWFCGPECQRGAWPQHKLICGRHVERGFVWGQASDELLWNSSSSDLDPEKALQKVTELSQAQDWGRHGQIGKAVAGSHDVARPSPSPMAGNLTTSTAQRHEAALAGASCPVIDAKGSFSPEVKRQLAEYFNPRRDQLYHTFASTQDARRFAYSFDCRNEGGYEPARIAEACKMTFKDFVTLGREIWKKQQAHEDGKAYYLQTPVLRYEDGVITSAKFDDEMEADLHSMNRRLVNELATLGKFGELSRNQLFVSFRDFLTAVHYDQQHNLFDVTCAPALYPYPVHHSLDRKARVDLERPDLATWPRAKALAGRGIEAVLGPGDVLFLPMSWFHHVHSVAGLQVGDENVSLNFWFYDSGFLFEPKVVQWPLSDISLLELCRHMEYLVAEQLGPSLVGSFMSWWQGEGDPPRDQLLKDRWRILRNYLLHQLRKLPSRSCRFVLAMMAPERWMHLDIQPQVAYAASQGLRDQHQVSELLTDLRELALGSLEQQDMELG